LLSLQSDRLCRFGFELIEWQLLQNDSKSVLDKKTNKSPDQELLKLFLYILQVLLGGSGMAKEKYTTRTREDKEN
jgi:predicted site-specific integrase-resolvase